MDLTVKLSKYFSLSEFLKPGAVLTSAQTANLTKLALNLDKLREWNGSALKIYDGLRSRQEQAILYKKYKGIYPVARPGTSFHEPGMAADIHWNWFKKPKAEVKAWLLKNWPGGVGFYSWGVHLDIGRKRHW
jgi:uncharacterized protein YcbK (DUF882 family)